ncbi:hypothetical protein FUT84_05190 [Treponema phagedenis]|nr:hypothetical protein FUT84_05190 [Treponema phagedenis]QEK03219.1 hypothetical protein FUT83_04965 [Treponema phagedenis]QEK05628.1 hypothetical protein FUT80_02110 [Treponema phagedenis]QEK08844.1 hypothetical protein FUT81_04945 [Treponema phagedenis]QSH96083.1 hypothetical protein C5O78_13865 [Treponema phagedenis]
MPNDKKSECRKIIHGSSVLTAAVGAGLAQLPCSDNAVIVPIQLGMIMALGKAFDIELTKSAAMALLAAAIATFVGRGISQVLVGWLPGIGNIMNAVTAAGITEMIGWEIAKDFSGKKIGQECDNDTNKL